MSQSHQDYITTLIKHYGLELDGNQVGTIVVTWLQKYDAAWIVKAIVESVFRGRYKVISVDNILKDWQRLGKPRHNFTPDFERERLQKLLAIQELTATPTSPNLPSLVDQIDRELPLRCHPVLSTEDLNPEESAPFQHHHRQLEPIQPVSEQISVIPDPEDRQVVDRIPNRQPIEDPIDPPTDYDTPSAPNNHNRSLPTLYLFKKLTAIVEPDLSVES